MPNAPSTPQLPPLPPTLTEAWEQILVGLSAVGLGVEGMADRDVGVLKALYFAGAQYAAIKCKRAADPRATAKAIEHECFSNALKAQSASNARKAAH